MHRISVVGAPGAGKSVFSRSMGRALGLDVLHIDLFFWAPAVHELSVAEQRIGLAKALRQPSHVLEGGFPWTYAERIANCDTLIWLDMPPQVRLFNMLKRHWSKRGPVGQHPPDAAARKRLAKTHSLKGVVHQQQDHATHLEPHFADPPQGVRMIRLQSRAALGAFLASLHK